MQKGDAFGLAWHHLEVWHAARRRRLLRRHVPGEIEATGQNLRELGLLVRDETKLKLGHFRLRFRAVLEVVGVALHADELAPRMLDDPERSGADRLFRHADRSGLGIV